MTITDDLRAAAAAVTVDEQNEVARAREIQRIRTLRNTFVETFGPPGKRTPHGAIIIREIERFCGTRRLINEVDNANATDIYRTARMHGRCDVIQAIHDIIEWKEPDPHATNRSGST